MHTFNLYHLALILIGVSFLPMFIGISTLFEMLFNPTTK